MHDLLAASCLVAVLEGLVLFAVPSAWKRVIAELLQTPDSRLRLAGAMMVGVGLLALTILQSAG